MLAGSSPHSPARPGMMEPESKDLQTNLHDNQTNQMVCLLFLACAGAGPDAGLTALVTGEDPPGERRPVEGGLDIPHRGTADSGRGRREAPRIRSHAHLRWRLALYRHSVRQGNRART